MIWAGRNRTVLVVVTQPPTAVCPCSHKVPDLRSGYVAESLRSRSGETNYRPESGLRKTKKACPYYPACAAIISGNAISIEEKLTSRLRDVLLASPPLLANLIKDFP